MERFICASEDILKAGLLEELHIMFVNEGSNAVIAHIPHEKHPNVL